MAHSPNRCRSVNFSWLTVGCSMSDFESSRCHWSFFFLYQRVGCLICNQLSDSDWDQAASALRIPACSLRHGRSWRICGSLGAGCYTWGKRLRGSVTHDKCFELWSISFKESSAAAAANAAAPLRFTAQLLRSISLTASAAEELEENEASPSGFFSLTCSITGLFISFFNELTLTSADSVSGIWAFSSLSPRRPPPKWQPHV